MVFLFSCGSALVKKYVGKVACLALNNSRAFSGVPILRILAVFCLGRKRIGRCYAQAYD